MMAQRKLQQEIDRVFKRVNEGLAAFDHLYEKVINCENPSQKEKLESDLKKEIKKLQRQREQIKNWLGSNDVKDKKPLLDYRKKIERQMERFKIVERDMKTKAFSKEGLNMERKLDPREREKLESSDFISENIEKINQQNETLEAKIQQIQSSVKKNKKLPLSKQNQIDSLQESLERNNWHLGKLETILRYLENGRVEPEQINEIKESIVYYVDSNQDPDFYDDDTVYDELGLDEVEPTFGTVGEFVSANPDSDDDVSDSEGLGTSAGDSNNALAPSSSASSKKDKDTNDLSNSIKDLSISSAGGTPIKKTTSISTTHDDTSNSHIDVNPAAVANSASPVIRASTPSVLNNLKPAPPKTTEVKYSALLQQQPKSSPVVSKAAPIKPAANVTPVVSYSKLVSNLAAASNIGATNNGSVPPIEHTEDSKADSVHEDETEAYSDDEKPILDYLPGLDDLIPFFKDTKDRLDTVYHSTILHDEKPEKQEQQNIGLINQHMANSLLNCPDSVDSEKPFSYFPSKPHPTSIDYPSFEHNIESLNNLNEENKNQGADTQKYNTNNFCLINSYNNREFFKKLSIETLFFIFYYGDDNGSNPKYYLNFQQELQKDNDQDGHQSDVKNTTDNRKDSSLLDMNAHDNGSYIQYIALKELHARNWKFNKKLHVWFQKLDNSDATGTKKTSLYKFFDFEVDWSIKLKEIDMDFSNDEFEKW